MANLALDKWNRRAPTTWLPIDSAPKDGQRILAARVEGSYCLWVHDARWLNRRPLEGPGWHYENATRLQVLIIPTHWAPLLPIRAADETKESQ